MMSWRPPDSAYRLLTQASPHAHGLIDALRPSPLGAPHEFTIVPNKQARAILFPLQLS